MLCSMENKFYQIPEHLRPKNEGTDELFTNGFMEKLTRTHISIPVTMHSIIVITFCYLAFQQVAWLTLIGLFFAGWLTWTLAEYWVHRYVYHVHNSRSVDCKDGWLVLEERTYQHKEHKGFRLRKGLCT